MAAPGRRRGRRNNGLDAADWRAIDDLDPRVSEDVLAMLAARGIAAYVQPAMDVDPITRSSTIPNRPTDRLYVDRAEVEAARDCLRRLLGPGPGPVADPEQAPGPEQPPGRRSGSDLAPTPAPGPPPTGPKGPARPPGATGAAGAASGDLDATFDATFAGIVAGFDRQVDPTAAAWPAAENLPGSTTVPGPAPAEPDPADREPPEPERRPAGLIDARSVTEPSLLDALDTFGTDLPDEPAERFVPPPPPPLPRLSRQTVLGALSIVVGLVLLLGQPAVLTLDRGTAMLLGFAAILGGAVALILRLRPDTEPEDTHPDDGAQV